MTIHKKLQPGDVVLKFKIPIARSALFDIQTAEVKRFEAQRNLQDIESYQGTMAAYYRGFMYSGLSSHLLTIAQPFNHISSYVPGSVAQHRYLNSNKSTYRSEISSRIFDLYAQDPLSFFKSMLYNHEPVEYHHFIVVLGSRRARSRGANFPSALQPFFDALKFTKTYTKSRQTLLSGDHYLTNIFHPKNHSSYDEISSSFNRVSSVSVPSGSELLNRAWFVGDDVPHFLKSEPREIYMFKALGTSMHMVSKEVYDTLEMNEHAQKVLSEMPQEFNRAFSLMQRVPLQYDRCFSIQDQLTNMYINENNIKMFHGQPNTPRREANFHLMSEDVIRESLVRHYLEFIESPAESQRPYVLLPYFRAQLHVQPMDLFPKTTLPTIELVDA